MKSLGWLVGALMLSGCGNSVALDLVPGCSGGWYVPQYRTMFITGMGNLRFEVKDAQGRPVPSAKINLRVKELRSILCGPAPFYTVGEDGTKTFDRVKSGIYVVTYYRDGEQSYSTSGFYEEREVEVKTGETTVVSFTKPTE